MKFLKSKKSASDGKVFRSGLYSAAITAAVIAAVVLLNLLVRAIPSKYTEFDLSEAGLYTLGDSSKQVARELSQDVTIYYLCETGNEDQIISKLLDKYAAESSHITWELKDPAVYPTFAAQYGAQEASSGSVILVSGDQNVVLDASELYDYDYSDYYTAGTYSVTYTVTDGYKNTTTVTRTVEVQAVPRPEVVWPEGKVIYLTFDDGPGPYTEQLLDVLDSYGVKATFFVTNRGYGEMMKEIVDRGHSIGIHTMSHVYERIYASPEAYFADLLGMQDVIYQNTGVKTTLMRFPGGSSNTVSAHSYVGLMSLLTRAVQDAGFQYFDWNVDSNDAGGAKKAQTVFNNVTAGVSHNRVSVVLQHDIHDFSVDAVEDIIVWGLNNGYSFERLTETSPGVHHGVQN